MKSYLRLLISLTLGWFLLIPAGLLGELMASPWLGEAELIRSALVLPVWALLVWKTYRLLGLLPFFS